MALLELIGEFGKERAPDILSILFYGNHFKNNRVQGSFFCRCGCWHKIEALGVLPSLSRSLRVYYTSERECGELLFSAVNWDGRRRYVLSTNIKKLKIEKVELER